MNDTLVPTGSRALVRWIDPDAPAPDAKRPLILVLGMHRSGTSLCAHMLSALGIDMADEIDAAPSNAKGHWERREIVEFHDRILALFNRDYYTPYHDFGLPVAWWADPRVAKIRREIIDFLTARMGNAPFGFKDPRTARLLPIWHQIVAELDLDAKLICCLRNPAQVARSLHDRDAFAIEAGEIRWLTYTVDLLRYTRNLDLCTLEYEAWFDTPQTNFEKLWGVVGPYCPGREFDTGSLLSGIIDEQLRHDGREHDRARLPLVRSVYDLARRADHDAAARNQILTIGGQYVAFDQMQAGLQREFERNRELARRVPALEKEAAALRADLLAAEHRAAAAAAREEERARDAAAAAMHEAAALTALEEQKQLLVRERVAAQLAAAEAVHAEVARLRQQLVEAEGRRRGQRGAAWHRNPAQQDDAAAATELEQARRELAVLHDLLAAAQQVAGEGRAELERELATALASIADLTAQLAESSAEADASRAREQAARTELERQRAENTELIRQRDLGALKTVAAAQREVANLRNALAEASHAENDRRIAAEKAMARQVAEVCARLGQRNRLAEETEAQLQTELQHLRNEFRDALSVRRTSVVGRIARRLRSVEAYAAISAAKRAGRSGDLAGSVRNYRRALAIAPELAPAWVQLGHALKDQGDLSGAEIAYRRSIAADPSGLDGHLHLAHLLKRRSRWDEAADLFGRALQLDPAAPGAAEELRSLGTQVLGDADRARDSGDWPAAAELYRAALKHLGDQVSVWVQLGHACKETGDYAAAEAAYRQAIALDPSAADPHLQLGHLLKLLSRVDEAADAYAGALEADPQFEPAKIELEALNLRLIAAGDQARDAQDLRRAARYYRRVLDVEPRNPLVWLRLGQALEAQSDVDAAEGAYRRAIELDPAAAEAYLRLGHLAERQAEHWQAIDLYAAAVRLQPAADEARSRLRELVVNPLAMEGRDTARAAAADRQRAGAAWDVIWLGVVDWHWRIQRPQHLATNLADTGARVFYVSLALEAPGENARFRIVGAPYPGVCEVKLRCPRHSQESLYRGFSPAAIGELQLAVDELATALRLRSPVVVVDHPGWHDVACSVPGATVVYDCLDLATGFSTAAKSTARHERAMVSDADLVVVASRPLVEHVAATRSSVLVRNAADVDAFVGGFSDRPPRQTPVIGYFGAISDWFNIGWIEHCAAARPDWEFRLVGRTDGCNTTRARQLPNVRFYGEKPYTELPAFLREVDVALIPFRMIELIRCTNPVKLYEYMAAGKPVVAAPMPEVIEATDLVYIAEDAASFVDRIGQALAEDNTELRLRRLAWARQHTWANRTKELQQAIDAIFPSVSVVVLTYNNWRLTEACLDSVRKLSNYPNLEIIVVDNASTDETRERLRELERQDSRLRVVLNDANLGFAAGNNIGLRLARGEYVVILNNDTVVTRGWVRDLIRPLLRDAGVGLTGPLTNNIGNEQKVKADYRSITEMHEWSRNFVRRRLRRRFEVNNLAFFCVAMRRSLLDEVGLLDEAYGIGFFEDDDYCRRVRRAGYRLLIVDDVFVHHHLSASIAMLGPDRIGELMNRNREIFEARWGAWEPHRYRNVPGFG